MTEEIVICPQTKHPCARTPVCEYKPEHPCGKTVCSEWVLMQRKEAEKELKVKRGY